MDNIPPLTGFRIEYSSLDLDPPGTLEAAWQVHYRISAKVTISVGDQVLFNEVYICVVEAMRAMYLWLRDNRADDFEYISIDDSDPIWEFRHVNSGLLHFSSSFDEQAQEADVSIDEVVAEVSHVSSMLQLECFEQWGVDIGVLYGMAVVSTRLEAPRSDALRPIPALS